MKVSHSSGLLPQPGEDKVILEAFREGTEPRTSGSLRFQQPVDPAPQAQSGGGTLPSSVPAPVEPTPVPGESGIY